MLLRDANMQITFSLEDAVYYEIITTKGIESYVISEMPKEKRPVQQDIDFWFGSEQ